MRFSNRFWLGAITVGGLCVILWIIFELRKTPDTASPIRPDVTESVAVPQPTAAPLTPTSLSSAVGMVPDTRRQQAYLAAFKKPISFVGKVVDEKGNGVPGATVEWRANNNPDPTGAGTNGAANSDERGFFNVRASGIALFVKVSKAGYYSVNEGSGNIRGSSGEFSNASVLGNTDHPMGTDPAPAIFVLRRRGAGTSLLHVNDRPVKIPKDGTPVEVALDTGRSVAPGRGHLRIECWTKDQSKDNRGYYPWRCRISVPGGGLTYRQDEFDFQAPAEGYQESDEITPDKLKWSSVGERQYFIKTGDGHFARVSLRIRTAGDHFIVIESYFNPARDSRDLEASTDDHSSPR
jgi:hypothetical protein